MSVVCIVNTCPTQESFSSTDSHPNSCLAHLQKGLVAIPKNYPMSFLQLIKLLLKNMDISQIEQLGKGAIKDIPDKRDYKFTANFSAVVLPTGYFSVKDKIPTIRNQNGSGSCGGQAFGYHMETNTLLRDGKFTPLSSKSIYQPVFISPEGSNARDLISRICSVGACLESDVPSYDNGNPPSEAFMEDGSKITPAMLITAKLYSGKTYLSFDSTDINQIKQAIFQGNGAVVALLGRNENWIAPGGIITIPNPNSNSTFWGHFLFLTGFNMIKDGIEYIEFVNSWGKEWGDNGYGYLPLDYFTKGYGYNEWVVIENPLPDNNFHHVFNTNLSYGQTSDEVLSLQKILVKDGYSTLLTGFYGDMTRKAVLQFQLDNKIGNYLVTLALQGRYVGPQTRPFLSKL